MVQIASEKTHKILIQAMDDLYKKKITEEQHNEIVKSCFRAEAERQILAGKYAEAV